MLFVILIANEMRITLLIQKDNKSGDSLIYIFSLEDANNYDITLAKYSQAQKRKKKKRRGVNCSFSFM